VVIRALALLTLLLAGCPDPDPSGPDMSANTMVIPCTRDEQCPATLPMCHPDSKICVGCTDSFQTCGPNLTCDPKTNTCVPADPNAPCRRNADCPRPGFDSIEKVACEVDAGMCFECVSNLDCVAPDTCQLDVHQCLGPDAGA
jgi:hypothetical protein